jgi:protoporphyrinogen/coproporphyrinogen III oxidase
MTERAHVLVLGGGITGLTAALRLTQRADSPLVTLVEASDRLGGKLRTERIDDFVVDVGPESLAPGRPDAVNLSGELGIDLSPAAAGAPGAVLVDGHLRTMPAGLGGFIPRQVSPLATTRLFSPMGKARMALEALIPARKGDSDESLESFASRRLGRQAYRRLVEPVASGIFCADPARLSLLATMPHLRAAERGHGGLLRAVLAERKAAKAAAAKARSASGGGHDAKQPPRPGPRAPEPGMERIVEALSAQLVTSGRFEALLETRLTALARQGLGYSATATSGAGSSRELQVGAVVLAVPAPAAAEVLDLLGAGEAATTLRSMPYATVATVSLGYRAAGLPDLGSLLPAHGYLLAEPGRGPVRAVTRSSAKYVARAPQGHELFRITLSPAATSTDDDLVAQARGELRRTLAIAAEPVITHVQRWTDVMPQYRVGHLALVAQVEDALAEFPGVVVAGSSVHGLGIPDCVASAQRAVAGLAAPAGLGA